jgi:hypothetical protein
LGRLAVTAYVTDAIVEFVERLHQQGMLTSRPVRLDGYTDLEISGVTHLLERSRPGLLVKVLSGVNNDETSEVNAERATRFRNQVDAAGHQLGFVLLVPLGQVVESSLDEPAFMVVGRSTLFKQALARLLRDRGISAGDLQALREASHHRHPESLYAFLSGWEPGRPADPTAIHVHLGLLADSKPSSSLGDLIARLHLNSQALEIVARAGLSESRMLDELATKVGAQIDGIEDDLLALQRWYRSGRQGPPPNGLDFGTWELIDKPVVEIRLEPNLLLPPHAGFKWVDDHIEVESESGASTIEWTIIRRTAATRFELDLIEDTTREVVKSLGKTKAAKKVVKWATVFKNEDDIDRLRELNPVGELEGFLLRIRLRVYDGSRWLSQDESDAFALRVPRLVAHTVAAPAPTLYHAMYEFHTARATSPTVVSPDNGVDNLVSVNLISSEGKRREARIDVGAPLLTIERAIAADPYAIGPWRWDSTNASATPTPSAHRAPDDRFKPYLDARRDFLARVSEAGSMEALDLRGPAGDDARTFVRRFEELVDSYVDYAREQGAVAGADRHTLAAIVTSDAVQVRVAVDDGRPPATLLLLSPTHPATVSWLLQFQELVFEWTRGKYDAASKPPYRADGITPAVLGGVESFAVGPRVMVMATPTDGGTPRAWGFAGNLTATWQVFVPVGLDDDVRARNWGPSLSSVSGLTNRPVGTGRMDARRIGERLKKYAVLHPYATQLKVAYVGPGDGRELLDSLRVIDEKSGTPAGAKSVRDIRYEVTLVGPEGEQFGRAVDDLATNPGDDRWRGYAAAILDNRETVLAPGFAYAKRPYGAVGPDPSFSAWRHIVEELRAFGAEGLHVAIIGPMLATSVGSAPAVHIPSGFRNSGLSARPSARQVAAVAGGTFEGNWLLAVNIPFDAVDGPLRTVAAVAAAVDVSHGVVSADKQVGLEVALTGAISDGLRIAHEVADWVIVADPLFSIELLDRPAATVASALLLDFSPEFEPYPEGRVVVTTQYLREVEVLGSAVANALSSTGAWTSILSSISARLLLDLANPTKQVVHGLAGLALSRTFMGVDSPGALVIPIDGHEDMFVFPKLGSGRILADLLAIHLDGDHPVFEVVESKWATKANLAAQVRHGAKQAANTAEVLRAAYFDYTGVDRALRLDNLREVVAFHAARARRHGVHTPAEDGDSRIASDDFFGGAEVLATVLAWCPDATFGTSAAEDLEGVTVNYLGSEEIEKYDRLMRSWPDLQTSVSPPVEDVRPSAAEEVVTESLEDDLRERRERETVTQADGETGSGLVGSDGAESGDNRLPRDGEDGTNVTEGATSELAVAGQSESPTIDLPGVTPGSPSPQLGGDLIVDQELAGPAIGDPAVTMEPCVRLGTAIVSTRAALWCPPALSNGHLLIVGGSGAGKTTALRHLAGEISRAVPVLVIDFHGDIEVPGHEHSVLEFDYSGNDTHVNPFHLDPSLGSKLSPSRLKWEFLEAWKSVYPSMGIHQTNYLASLIEEAYASLSITEDPRTWGPDMSFGNVLEQFENGEGSESMRAKIASYMKQFEEWRIFHGGASINVESFLSATTRLDLSQLYETARDILADVVLRRLFLLVRAMGPLAPDATGWKKFRIYVVIDEAQILMRSSSDAKASLARYAAEARKFGIGLVMATQLRDNVPADIWGNVDTRLFMQALDPGERARNAKAANVPEAMLKSLSRGEAILTSSSQPDAPPIVLRIQPSWL